MVGRSFIVRLIMVLFVGVVSIVAIYPYYSMIMMGTTIPTTFSPESRSSPGTTSRRTLQR